MHLSDAYLKADNSGEYEWTAHLVNINLGKNKNLMKQCKKLEDYAILIDKIRRYKKECNDLEQAVNRAVDECIAEQRLEDFLLPHKSEVVGMILTEWDEEKYIQDVKEESEKRGEERGIKIGEKRRLEMVIKYYAKGYLPLEEALEETDMTKDELQKAVELYQKEQKEAKRI